jgi:hypothetical protein
MADLLVSILKLQPFRSLLSSKGWCAVIVGGSRSFGEAIVRVAEAGAGVSITGRGRPPSARLP